MQGAESLEDIRRRVINVANDILSNYHGGLLLVSHGVLNKALICSLPGLENSQSCNIKRDVGGITVFNYVGGHFVLTKHNNSSPPGDLRKSVLDDF
jgi:broad specificity phosphatase PhoE